MDPLSVSRKNPPLIFSIKEQSAKRTGSQALAGCKQRGVTVTRERVLPQHKEYKYINTKGKVFEFLYEKSQFGQVIEDMRAKPLQYQDDLRIK